MAAEAEAEAEGVACEPRIVRRPYGERNDACRRSDALRVRIGAPGPGAAMLSSIGPGKISANLHDAA